MQELIKTTFFVVYGIALLGVGYAGIDFHFGPVLAALSIAVLLRLTLPSMLPLTVGAFFGLMDFWHWHWALAALFVAPGFAYIIYCGIIEPRINSETIRKFFTSEH
jgi:hypothetical protein